MEIKIITNGEEVTIFEGENINLRTIYYNDNEDFIKGSSELLAGYDTIYELGVPDSIREVNSPSKSGSYINLRFKNKAEYYSCIIKNSVIYITNNGKTIDTSRVD